MRLRDRRRSNRQFAIAFDGWSYVTAECREMFRRKPRDRWRAILRLDYVPHQPKKKG